MPKTIKEYAAEAKARLGKAKIEKKEIKEKKSPSHAAKRTAKKDK